MKKVLVVAAALTFAGGAASAASWGGFSSYGGWKSGGKSHSTFLRGYSSHRWGRGSIIKIVKHVRSGGCLLWCGGRVGGNPGNGGGNTTTDVPVPAAGFLLVAGLGGLAAMKRRKKA